MAPTASPAKTSPAAVAPPQSAASTTQTLQSAEATVAAWARAWATQDVDAHLAFYANDFVPPAGVTRAEWEAQRRERIIQPSRISVNLSGVRAQQINPDKVSVSFKQTYESDRLSVTSNKILELVWRSGKWLIVQETTR